MPNNGGRQMRFLPEELQTIKDIFKDERILKLLRKVFLPEYDPYAPIGQTVDLWMTVPASEVTPEYAYINWKARNQLITHVEQQLMQLSVLANQKDETEAEKVERLKKDSTM